MPSIAALLHVLLFLLANVWATQNEEMLQETQDSIDTQHIEHISQLNGLADMIANGIINVDQELVQQMAQLPTPQIRQLLIEHQTDVDIETLGEELTQQGKIIFEELSQARQTLQHAQDKATTSTDSFTQNPASEDSVFDNVQGTDEEDLDVILAAQTALQKAMQVGATRQLLHELKAERVSPKASRSTWDEVVDTGEDTDANGADGSVSVSLSELMAILTQSQTDESHLVLSNPVEILSLLANTHQQKVHTDKGTRAGTGTGTGVQKEKYAQLTTDTETATEETVRLEQERRDKRERRNQKEKEKAEQKERQKRKKAEKQEREQRAQDELFRQAQQDAQVLQQQLPALTPVSAAAVVSANTLQRSVHELWTAKLESLLEPIQSSIEMSHAVLQQGLRLAATRGGIEHFFMP